MAQRGRHLTHKHAGLSLEPQHSQGHLEGVDLPVIPGAHEDCRQDSRWLLRLDEAASM